VSPIVRPPYTYRSSLFVTLPLVVSVLGLPGPYVQNLNLTDSFGSPLGPTSAHPFGVDQLGEDVMTRVIYGTRVSLEVGIIGTGILTILASGIAIPLGVLGGIYMAEFSKGGRFSEGLRFCADVLAGVPSIVLGYVCFLTFVIYFNWGYSALAGAVALSIIMFPYIFRTTEIAIKKVPVGIKEGAIALGSTKATMINRLVLRFALPGILTGILLSIGIALSETAPLLYTANFANYNPTGLLHSQLGYLTGFIWLFYQSPLPQDVDLAYLATFLLILIVLTLNVAARFGLKRFSKV